MRMDLKPLILNLEVALARRTDDAGLVLLQWLVLLSKFPSLSDSLMRCWDTRWVETWEQLGLIYPLPPFADFLGSLPSLSRESGTLEPLRPASTIHLRCGGREISIEKIVSASVLFPTISLPHTPGRGAALLVPVGDRYHLASEEETAQMPGRLKLVFLVSGESASHIMVCASSEVKARLIRGEVAA